MKNMAPVATAPTARKIPSSRFLIAA